MAWNVHLARHGIGEYAYAKWASPPMCTAARNTIFLSEDVLHVGNMVTSSPWEALVRGCPPSSGRTSPALLQAHTLFLALLLQPGDELVCPCPHLLRLRVIVRMIA